MFERFSCFSFLKTWSCMKARYITFRFSLKHLAKCYFYHALLILMDSRTQTVSWTVPRVIKDPIFFLFSVNSSICWLHLLHSVQAIAHPSGNQGSSHLREVAFLPQPRHKLQPTFSHVDMLKLFILTFFFCFELKSLVCYWNCVLYLYHTHSVTKRCEQN